jgi:hypothetical protein
VKGASLWIGRVFESGYFLGGGSLYQFFLEVYFPFNSLLPPYFRLGEAVICDLLYIVNHAVQEPLDIYFDFPPERKTV